MKPLKILVLDDDTETLKTINKILIGAYENIELLNATEGNFALEIIHTENPDIIISDWQMPKMTGLELIEILRRKPETAIIPVIICTGIMLQKENLIEARTHGAIDYIRKPVEESELIARINSIVHFLEMRDNYHKVLEEKKELEKILLQDELEKLTKEINTRILIQFKNNELLRNTMERLRDMPFCTESSNCKKYITEVVSDITNGIFNENWENMTIAFEKLYPTFFDNLLSKFPQLSKNEKRLCALLKLGLSTKDISAITMQSQRAVEVARHRMRTKMELSKDENISDYL